MQNRLTIKDIARLSGVGKSTVSRVLNNESGVSQRTRERVEAVMNQHGFSPSRSARAGHCLIFFGAQLRPLAFAGIT